MSIRAMVRENLDNALENGNFDPGDELYDATPEDVAADMIAFAADCEDIDDPAELVPIIREWMIEKSIPMAKVQ